MLGYYDRAGCGEASGLDFFARISQEKATFIEYIEEYQSQVWVMLFIGNFTAQSNNKIFNSQGIKIILWKWFWHAIILNLDRVLAVKCSKNYMTPRNTCDNRSLFSYRKAHIIDIGFVLSLGWYGRSLLGMFIYIL